MAITAAMQSILDGAEAAAGDVTALRRKLHRRPELGLQLPETQAAVLEALQGLPLEVGTGERTTSVIATLEGAHAGPTIVLRGDMDALPLQEDTGLDFASELDGRMHACGHDAHTAMLVGALHVLAGRRDELHGRVMAMFQPGEEGFNGASLMISEGLLDLPDGTRDPTITGAFAIHITPSAPTGFVVGKGGTMLASADEFTVTVHGRGGHGSLPHQALDPIPIACEIVMALQAAVTRRVDVFDPVIISVCELHAGTTTNVIPPDARIRGTIRATSNKARDHAHRLVGEVASGVAAAHGATAEVVIDAGYRVTSNHGGFVQGVAEVARDLLGDKRVAIPVPNPVMGAEDFGEVLDRVPGCMVFLGACPPGMDPATAPSNHSNLMQLDEAALPLGVALHAAVALRHLSAAPGGGLAAAT
ncbi:MAG TPA: M20 family metallopeptidase [Acidimicrobiales bacterium]|jgi:hippurate hydrolase|nr:M20 family metallopeptidase [Acidimicrobiales bacterium]